MVTELVPAVMEPEVVPPRVPVPLVRDNCTAVDATTLAGFPFASCACTVTLNALPGVVLAGAMDVITGLVAAPATTENAKLSPEVIVSPPVRVAVTTTPDSPLVYVTPLIV